MITTSLELSKRLKEAGYPQGKTDFYYVMQRGDWDLYTDYNCDQCWSRSSFRTKVDAPTAEEILEKLPNELESSGDYFFLNCHKDGQWLVSYYSMLQNYTCYINGRRVEVNNESLVDACALMYLHLKEHNLL